MGFVTRFAIGAAATIAVLTVGHELGHAGLNHRDGYRGPWHVHPWPSREHPGNFATYHREQAGPSLDRHHDILHPATYTVAVVGGLTAAVWASRAKPRA